MAACVHCGLTCRCPDPTTPEQRNPPCRECGRPVEDERLIYAQPTCLTCLPRPEPLPIRPAPEQRDPAVVEIVEEAIREGDAAQHPTLHDWVRAVAIRAVEATLKLADERVGKAYDEGRRDGETSHRIPGDTHLPCPDCVAYGKAEGSRAAYEDAADTSVRTSPDIVGHSIAAAIRAQGES